MISKLKRDDFLMEEYTFNSIINKFKEVGSKSIKYSYSIW